MSFYFLYVWGLCTRHELLLSSAASLQYVRVSPPIACACSALPTRTRRTSLHENSYQLFSASSPRNPLKKRPFAKRPFFIHSKGLGCNQCLRVLYGIATGVWHHVQRVSALWIDAIHNFVMISFRRQAADSIHALGVICASCIFCTMSPQKWAVSLR